MSLRYTTVIVLVAIALLAFSCDTTISTNSTARGRVLPNITGASGEVMVVMDNFNWNNSAGEMMKDILQEEYPGLPQSEPLFSVTHITAASFDNVYQFHRSIVLVKVSSGLDPQIRFKENIWAKPQLVIQMEAGNSAELHNLIEENENRIQSFLEQYDRKRRMENYEDSKDLSLYKEVINNHQVRLSIPRGYNLDFSTENYTSISIETPDHTQTIQVYEYPVESKESVTVELILSKRNEFTRKYVEGPVDGSYMIIAPIFPPIVYDIVYNRKELIEMRGLWELENGFMGGPFVSHTLYDEDRNRVVTVDGYVYFPNQKKRTKLRQLEAIIYSMELI